MTTDNLDLSSYSELKVDFNYYARSMDNSNEDFWLQISTDGGTSFTTVEEWNRNDEFVNDQRYFETVVVNGPFTATTQVRFRCDASGNSDWVYIDDVKIVGCLNNFAAASQIPASTSKQSTVNNVDVKEDVKSLDFEIFPNPFSERIQLVLNDYNESAEVIVELISFANGQTIYKQSFNNQYIELSNLPIANGTYAIRVIHDNKVKTKRIVKIQ